jgi:cellulose biosynthesis protein BcsQ
VLIAVGSVKGSPGATTFAVALAARWAGQEPVVVVEADPAGGDLATRFGHYPEPGLVALATAGRRADNEAPVVAQCLALGVDVVLAPAGPEATQTVSMLVRESVPLLRAAGRRQVLILDVGRLDPASPALPLLAEADLVLAVTRLSVEAVDALDLRMPALAQAAGGYERMRLVAVGDSPLATDRILTGSAQAMRVLATVPEDRRGADVLSGRARPGHGWTRLPLPRAARAAALRLRDDVAPRPVARAVVAPRQHGTLLGRRDEAAQVRR